MDDIEIVKAVDALEAQHTELVGLVGLDNRTRAHVSEATTLDAGQPLADPRRREKLLEHLDAAYVKQVDGKVRDMSRAVTTATKVVNDAWARAHEAPSEAEQLERRFTAQQLTLRDRQTAALLDATVVATHRARLAESTLAEVSVWYEDAVQRNDTTALRVLEAEAQRRPRSFPMVRRSADHMENMRRVDALVVRRVPTVRLERAILARPDLVEVQKKLDHVQTSLSGILTERQVMLATSFTALRGRLLTKTEQQQHRQFDSMLAG